MRYANRYLSSNERTQVRNYVEYWRSVKKLGFDTTSVLYTVFASDSFHDGGIRPVRFDTATMTATMQFVNVLSIDKVTAICSRSGRKPTRSIRRSDFVTTAVFSGITSLSVRLRHPIVSPIYIGSNIGRSRTGHSILEMLVGDETSDARGLIHIVFRCLKVDNIFPRIRNLYCCKSRAQVETWLNHDPGYYLNKWYGYYRVICRESEKRASIPKLCAGTRPV